jgi:hypothetical protein
MGLGLGLSARRTDPSVDHDPLGTGHDLTDAEARHRYLLTLAAFSASNLPTTALGGPTMADIREALSGVPAASVFWAQPDVASWARHAESMRAVWPEEALPAFP